MLLNNHLGVQGKNMEQRSLAVVALLTITLSPDWEVNNLKTPLINSIVLLQENRVF